MGIGYKLFKVKKSQKGKLFPLYVLADKETPMGVWLDAEVGILTPNGKIKSKLGELALRAGWHLSDIPYATHIGIKDKNGNIVYMHDDEVWCEVEYADAINYQQEANRNGYRNGKFYAKYACFEHVPVNGFYRYKTNPNMTGDWIISGAIKVNRILSDKEVESICKEYGLTPLPRRNSVNLSDYGF